MKTMNSSAPVTDTPTGPMAITRRSIIARDGRTLTVRTAGPDDALPVVLLHGQLHASSCWIGIMESTLSRQVRLIAPDMAGHGGSQPPRQGDSRWIADDLDDILVALGARRPVLVGWSFGSVVACAYERSRRQTRGLVLVGAGTRTAGPAGITLAQVRALLAAQPTPATPRSVAVELFTAMLCGDPAVEDEAITRMVDISRHFPLDEASRSLQMADARAITPETRLLIATTAYDNAAFFTRYEQPILQIHGAHDALRPLTAAQERAALFRFGETEIWSDSGHAPFDDEKERFVRRLAAFCEMVEQ